MKLVQLEERNEKFTLSIKLVCLPIFCFVSPSSLLDSFIFFSFFSPPPIICLPSGLLDSKIPFRPCHDSVCCVCVRAVEVLGWNRDDDSLHFPTFPPSVFFFLLFPCQPPLISISYFVVKRYTGHGQHERVLVSQLHAISSKDKQAASRYLII